MPTILRWKGYKFHFYSREEDRPHIHIQKDDCEAKFWLGTVELADSVGFSRKDLNMLEKKVREKRDTLLGAWHDYFDA